MPFTPYGDLGQPFVSSDPRIWNTERTFKEIVYFEKDVVFSSGASAQALARSANFSIANKTGWAHDGAGNAWFYGTTILGGSTVLQADLYSDDYDGSGVPDPLATKGWFLEYLTGQAQFQEIYAFGGELADMTLSGELTVEDSITLSTGGAFRTAASGQRIEMTEANFDRISLFSGEATESQEARIFELGYADPVTIYPSTRIQGPMATGDFFPAFIELSSQGAGPSTVPQMTLFTYEGALRLESWHTDGIQMYDNSTLRFQIKQDDILFNDDGGTTTFWWDESADSWLMGKSLFTQKIHTGGTAWTQEPWSTSTIELGNYGAIGTQGNYGLTIAWNWERGTDSGYYAKSAGGYNDAYAIELKDGGIFFYGDTTYAATGYPTSMFKISTDRIASTTAYGGAIKRLAGSAALPALTFVSDYDTGFYRSAANQISVSTGSVSHGYWNTSGWHIITIGTTGSAANMHWTSADKRIRYNTSARKYKDHINYQIPFLADYELKPAHFYRKDDDAWFFDFIADDLADQNPLFGQYDAKGEVENYHKPAVMAVLAAKVNRLEAQVRELQRTTL